MDERNSTIKLETARNGSTVPVVNGIYLHSIYDPEKEAEAFVETFEKQLQKKKHVLILGLGFGYHVKKVAEVLRRLHGDFHITVLEPNIELIKIVQANKFLDEDEITLIHFENPKKLYAKESFVKFLIKKPSLLKHESSFSLNKDLYKEFLIYKSSPTLKDHSEQTLQSTHDLLTLDLNKSFSESVDELNKRNTISSRSDYLTLALNALINPEQEETSI